VVSSGQAGSVHDGAAEIGDAEKFGEFVKRGTCKVRSEAGRTRGAAEAAGLPALGRRRRMSRVEGEAASFDERLELVPSLPHGERVGGDFAGLAVDLELEAVLEQGPHHGSAHPLLAGRAVGLGVDGVAVGLHP